jgi:hypothetical protein
MTVEWPTLALGILLVLAGGLTLLWGPVGYQIQRQLPKWMLPVARLWPQRLDIWIVRVAAAALAMFGAAMAVGAFFA